MTNCSYVRCVLVRVSRCARDVECRRLLLVGLEAATTAAFASPFLLYLLCRRGDGGRETGVRGDIFHRAVCLQLLFQRKFANGSPLSPLVQRSCAGFHILRAAIFFFRTHQATYIRRVYVYHRQDATSDTRVTIFMPWPRPTVNKVRPPARPVDLRSMNDCKKMQSPAHEGPSPWDSAEKRTAGEVNFCFPGLFSDCAGQSGVELRTPECSYSRKSGLSEVVGPSLRAPCAPAGSALQGTKSKAVQREEEELKCLNLPET